MTKKLVSASIHTQTGVRDEHVDLTRNLRTIPDLGLKIGLKKGLISSTVCPNTETHTWTHIQITYLSVKNNLSLITVNEGKLLIKIL